MKINYWHNEKSLCSRPRNWQSNVLKAVISDKYGGMTYMFPETEILNEINGITFRMYVEQKRVTLVIGFSMNTVTAEKITFGLRATSTFLRGTVRPGFLCGISEKIFDDEDAGGRKSSESHVQRV